MDHELIMKAVRHHTDLAWIHLYLERWLKAPLQDKDGRPVVRGRGSPQGSAISPLLANLFLHYAFDAWMARTHPETRFERYCDDIVVHCPSWEQACALLEQITARLAAWGLVVNQEKTRIVYCHDDRRRGRHVHEQFDFLGYTFGPRQCKSGRDGSYFVGFNPAVSDQARITLGQTIRRWRLGRRSGHTLTDLAAMINPIVRGWIRYYGRYFPSRLATILARINEHLVRWATRKYQRLRRHPQRAWRFLAAVASREPGLFAHWAIGLVPTAG
jgi:group II intron reverse transcriptase/maturase